MSRLQPHESADEGWGLFITTVTWSTHQCNIGLFAIEITPLYCLFLNRCLKCFLLRRDHNLSNIEVFNMVLGTYTHSPVLPVDVDSNFFMGVIILTQFQKKNKCFW